MEMDRRNIFYGLAALVIGGLVGAVVMGLFAPQSGRETRGLIVDKSRRIKDRVVETAEETTHRAGKTVSELTQQARDTANSIFRRGRLAAEDFKSNIEEEAKSKSVQFGR